MKILVRYIFPLSAFIASFLFIQQFNPLSKDHSEESSAEPSGALQALNFWTESRAYPENDIPADVYYREYMAAKSRIPPLAQTAAVTPAQQAVDSGAHTRGDRLATGIASQRAFPSLASTPLPLTRQTQISSTSARGKCTGMAAQSAARSSARRAAVTAWAS